MATVAIFNKENKNLKVETDKLKEELQETNQGLQETTQRTRNLEHQLRSICWSHAPQSTQASVGSAVVKAMQSMPCWRRKFLTPKLVYNCTTVAVKLLQTLNFQKEVPPPPLASRNDFSKLS